MDTSLYSELSALSALPATATFSTHPTACSAVDHTIRYGHFAYAVCHATSACIDDGVELGEGIGMLVPPSGRSCDRVHVLVPLYVLDQSL